MPTYLDANFYFLTQTFKGPSHLTTVDLPENCMVE